MSLCEIVVGASLALKLVEREPYSDEASRVFQNRLKQRRRNRARFVAYDAINGLVKRLKRRQPTAEVAKERLASLLENGPALENDVALNLGALEMMERFSVPSAYDAHYLALAESRQCESGRRTSVSGTQLSGSCLGFVGSFRWLTSKRVMLDDIGSVIGCPASGQEKGLSRDNRIC